MLTPQAAVGHPAGAYVRARPKGEDPPGTG